MTFHDLIALHRELLRTRQIAGLTRPGGVIFADWACI